MTKLASASALRKPAVWEREASRQLLALGPDVLARLMPREEVDRILRGVAALIAKKDKPTAQPESVIGRVLDQRVLIRQRPWETAGPPRKEERLTRLEPGEARNSLPLVSGGDLNRNSPRRSNRKTRTGDSRPGGGR